jgi:hypothetical protein
MNLDLFPSEHRTGISQRLEEQTQIQSPTAFPSLRCDIENRRRVIAFGMWSKKLMLALSKPAMKVLEDLYEYNSHR